MRASGAVLYRLVAGAALVAGLIVAAGCDTPRAPDPVDPVPRETDLQASPREELNPEVARWLAGLRAATAAFHDVATAARAGWSARITDCMALPDSGGMGFHYANNGLIDGTLQERKPELLVYAPRRDGSLALVAVEYIVPFAVRPADGPPPVLHGIPLHRNDVFGLWVLHAWVWKHNPAGIFADWNPDVSCAFAR